MQYEIDTRPLPLVIFKHLTRYIIIGLIGVFFVWFIHLPPFSGLSSAGQKAIGVFLLCVMLWLTQMLPLAATGLLAVIAPPLLGIMDSKAVYAYFGNQSVFFILGAFILAAAVMKSGLSTRLTLALLTRVGNSPKRLLLSVLFIPLFIAFWIPEHAVAVMFFPILLEIVHALKLKPGRSRFGASLFVAMGWGCITGGVTTLLGGARAPLALAILDSTKQMSVSFFEWMLAAWPVTLILGLSAAWIVPFFFPSDLSSIEPAVAALKNKMFLMGRMSFNEKAIAVLMIVTIYAWMFLSAEYGIANIALLSVVVLFVFRLIEWKTIEQYVNWGVVLMYGGAITLGVVLKDSGAAGWIAERFLSAFLGRPFLFVAMLVLLATILTEAVSNAAVVAILLPVALGMTDVLGLNPRFITLAIGIPAGLGYMFPMASPPNAIAHSAEFFRVRDVLLPGLILNLISWLVFLFVAKFYWPFIGFSMK
ncbi:MAG: DASS family sodium-coupled anion symporter [Candidatus Omnitrophica bacterium]|nr:DASS family sodium-coupled anion symporter [Candidatus Omnitrophota bacterium]